MTNIWAKTDIKRKNFAQRAKKGPHSGPHLLVATYRLFQPSSDLFCLHSTKLQSAILCGPIRLQYMERGAPLADTELVEIVNFQLAVTPSVPSLNVGRGWWRQLGLWWRIAGGPLAVSKLSSSKHRSSGGPPTARKLSSSSRVNHGSSPTEMA